jgi:maltose-binding protein MalE
MAILTRRSVLRGSLGLAATGALSRPYVANAAATTAEVWWAQGFVPEEDESLKKIVADYQKATGNTIDLSIMPFAPQRQKIVSAVTSGVVPDLFQNNPDEIIALYAWDDKLVDVTDVVDTQKEEFTDTALLQQRRKKAQLLRCTFCLRGIAEPYLEAAGRESRLQDGGHPKNLGCLLRFLQRGAQETARPGRA